MNVGRVFAFVKVQSLETLKASIKDINRQRQIPILYRRLIYTAPRRNWLALLFDNENADYYLLRNLSKQMMTDSFGLNLSGIQISYRYFVNGKMEAGYESHLELKLLDRLRRLIVTHNLTELDREEPAEVFVQYLYRQYQQKGNTWDTPMLESPVPPHFANPYQPDIPKLKNLLKPDVDTRYIEEVLSPGYSPETIMERLVNALQLPYLSPADEVVFPYDKDPTLKRSLSGTAILDPRRWPESQPLPNGWETLTIKDWT